MVVWVKWFQDGSEGVTDGETSSHLTASRSDPNVEKKY